MIIGIVGAEEAKFTPLGRERAVDLIWKIILDPEVEEVCSGECHLGGIDIWAHEIADALGMPFTPFPPKTRSWLTGYMPRNLQIANHSHVVHNIVVDSLPEQFKGMRFGLCYHCNSKDHVKSGGCWTMKKSRQGVLHVIANY